MTNDPTTTTQEPDINVRTPESVARAMRKRAALVIKPVVNFKPLFEDTPEEREAWALGEAWRKAQKDP